MQHNEAQIKTNDGFRLYYQAWRPDGRAKGALAFLHGQSDHSGRFAWLGDVLSEAGYEDGIDPATGKPLVIHFDVGNTSSRARLFYRFHVDCWRKLGLDVKLEATN